MKCSTHIYFDKNGRERNEGRRCRKVIEIFMRSGFCWKNMPETVNMNNWVGLPASFIPIVKGKESGAKLSGLVSGGCLDR